MGQLRVDERARVAAASADLGETWSCCVFQLGDARAEPRDVQLFERDLLLPAKAQSLLLQMSYWKTIEKCTGFTYHQPLVSRGSRTFLECADSMCWHTTGDILGHCSTRVTVTRDEDI